MTSWKIGAALACGIAGGAALSLQPRGAVLAQATVAWRTDYAQAAAQAKREGKPVLVAFRCER